MSGLRQSTLAGVRWMAVSQAAGQVSRFVIAAVLARLVSPPEFGLFQMATVFTGFAALLCDVGLGAALIQRPQVDDRQFTAIFWLNVAVALSLAAILAACSLPIAHFYKKPAVAALVCAVSADFVLSSLAIVHRSRLIRAMNFRKLALAEMAGVLVGGAAAVVMAFMNMGVWSLVALVVCTTAFTTLALWRLETWRPALVFRGLIQRELLGFGLNLQGFNVINYWLRNLDKFLVGKFLGEAQLGFYMRGYTTMLLPQSQVSGVLERVLWPALSRCSSDPERLRLAYLRALRLVCFISFPLLAGLLVTAADFVRVVYGRGWEDTVPALRWLCLAGLAQAPMSTAGWLYLATGRTRRMLGWGVVAGLFIAAGIVAGVAMGSIVHVAAIYAVVCVVLLPLAFVAANPCAGLRMKEVFRAQAGSFLNCVVMALPVAAMAAALPAHTPPSVRLALCIAAGVLIYGGVAHLGRMTAAREFVEVVRDMMRRNAAPQLHPPETPAESVP